jgi:hypothetical protein
MRPDGIVVATPLGDRHFGLNPTLKALQGQTHITQLTLKNSSAPFCHGWPVPISAVSMLVSCNHCWIAPARDSGSSLYSTAGSRIVAGSITHLSMARRKFVSISRVSASC